LIKISFDLIVKLAIFFIFFFLSFTLIPRLIYSKLVRLLIYENEPFFDNLFNIIGTYLLLGIPLTFIFYFTSTFGEQNQIHKVFGTGTALVSFFVSIIFLICIRTSILLKKRKILAIIPKVKDINNHIPSFKFRKELKAEYTSFLFSLFFTAFMSFLSILMFKVIFLADYTEVAIGGYHGTITDLFHIISVFIKSNWIYALIALLIIILSETILKWIGTHELGN